MLCNAEHVLESYQAIANKPQAHDNLLRYRIYSLHQSHCCRRRHCCCR
jgi:hypothetical protein